ncbi:unnamed protein product [Mytilus coruscus]|uniref:Uncharacterized protein n=1 Tax=Mytilus coruscus TaxID=42192 RepID=A0A6J8E0J2_MYTCO|nr:unnamed protein product [Mytilus coruscus]
MFFELLHPRAALSGTQFQYSVPRLEYGNSILARTKKLFPEIKPESRSKILFNLAWEAVKPLYNDKTDIHKSCQTSLNDVKKDIVIGEEENVQTIVGEFGSMIETDNNLSSDFTLPVSSIINTSPLQPFGAIPPKLSSTPTSGKCVHSVITIQTPPLSFSPQASSITSSVILPSSQSSITMLPSQTFSMMQHSPSSQKFAVMLSLPLYQTSVAIVSSPLIHTSAVTVSSPLLQTATVIVSSPLLQTAAVIVSSPLLQTAAVIVSSPLLQIAAVIVSSPLLQPAAVIVSSPLLQTSAVNLLSPLLQTSAVNLLSQLLQTSS